MFKQNTYQTVVDLTADIDELVDCARLHVGSFYALHDLGPDYNEKVFNDIAIDAIAVLEHLLLLCTREQLGSPVVESASAAIYNYMLERQLPVSMHAANVLAYEIVEHPLYRRIYQRILRRVGMMSLQRIYVETLEYRAKSRAVIITYVEIV